MTAPTTYPLEVLVNGEPLYLIDVPTFLDLEAAKGRARWTVAAAYGHPLDAIEVRPYSGEEPEPG